MTGWRDHTGRTYWQAPDLGIRDEPLLLSLLRYKRSKDRWRVGPDEANLVSSISEDGRQLPILDLDFAHVVRSSSTTGHNHLYIDVPMSRFRWTVLMLALYYAGVVELGFVVWSLRRGGNFVRLPGTAKKPGTESTYSQYGWLFKRRNHDDAGPGREP
jgi:hypothetical protein